MEINYSKGKIDFNRLEILNKSDFKDKNIFEARKLTIEIEFSSIFSDLVKINKFILIEPKFFFEIKDLSEKKETTIDNIGLVEKIIKQIKKVSNILFPNNQLQERHENFISMYLKYGDNFIKNLISILDPLDSNFVILE